MMSFSMFDENLNEEFVDENVSASSINTSPNLEKNMTGSQFHFSKEITSKPRTQPCEKTKARSSFPSMDDALLQSKKLSIFKKYKRPQRILKKKNQIESLLNPTAKVQILAKNISESKGYEKNAKDLSQGVSNSFIRVVTMSDINAPDCF